jgi:CHASE3 domain sensor protein
MQDRKTDRLSRIPELAMLFASLAVVVTVALISYQSGDQAKRAREEGKTSRELHDLSEQLISSLKDAETGERGFLLTGREHYLEPFNHAASSIPLLLQLLRDQSRRARLSAVTRTQFC